MAHPHTRSAHRFGGSHLSHGLERIVLAFVVCVPVPAFALSGLSIPLPGVVERVAAALVPWANAPTLETQALAASTTRGSIVLVRGSPSESDRRDATRARTLPSSPPPGVTARSAMSPSEATAAPQAGPGRETEPTGADPAPEPTEPHGDDDGGVGGGSVPSPEPAPTDPDAGPGNSGGGQPPGDEPEEKPEDKPQVTPGDVPDVPDETPDDLPDVTPPDRPDVTPPDRPDVTPPDRPDVTPPNLPDVTPPDLPDVTPDKPDKPHVNPPVDVPDRGPGK
jgi:hypothetical protein